MVGVVFPDAVAPGIEFDMPVDFSQRVDQGQGRSEVVAVVEVDMGDGGGGRQEFLPQRVGVQAEFGQGLAHLGAGARQDLLLHFGQHASLLCIGGVAAVLLP